MVIIKREKRRQSRFNQIPVFAIELILMYPVANAMAFGGAATGNIKANVAPMHPATINRIGSAFKAVAAAATIG